MSEIIGGVAAAAGVVEEPPATTESVVCKVDEFATTDSLDDAIEGALTAKSPGTLGRLFAADSVSHMVIRMPL